MTQAASARYGPTKMTSSEAFVEQLVAEKVTVVPGIVGSAFMDALDLFPAAGIRFLSVAHEQNAAHMADGYARVSGKPTAIIAQNGPGITNFVTGVAAAFGAHTPMVVVTPSAGSMGVGHFGFQEAEQLSIFSKITKWQAQVNRPERMAELTRRAFYIAKTEHGPVQLDIPRDYFYAEGEYEIYPSARVSRGPGEGALLEAATAMLRNARRPVIVSGGGVVQADGVADVAALAEYVSAPVATSYLHNDAFPFEHPLSVGPLGYQGSKAAMRSMESADVVLAIGCRLNPFGTLPQHGLDYWPRSAPIIQIDSDQRRLGLTRRVEIGICADAAEAARALLDLLKKSEPNRVPDGERLAEVASRCDEWAAELASWSSKSGEPISPRRALALIRDALPSDAIVATDIGNICSVSNSYLHFNRARSFLAAMTFGNCGYAYPTALGAKVAAPDRPVLAYVGDGAWGMSMAEVMTAVRQDIPVVAVVWNNQQWGAEKKNQLIWYADRFVGTNLDNPNFAAIGELMGARGIRVSSENDLQPAITEAIGCGRAAVLQVDVDPAELGDPFRRDAMHYPTRHLEKYAHLITEH